MRIIFRQTGFGLLAWSLVMVLGCGASAQSVKVIANPSVQASSITPAELKSVFLLEKNTLRDGSHVEPVLARGGLAHEAFLRFFLGRTDGDLQTYYRSLVFTGRGNMPKTVDSDADIVAYVAKTRGAIGYVNSDIDAVGVKALDVAQYNAKGPDRTVVWRVEPEYPEVLRQRSIGGTVRLQVTIAPVGTVENVRILGGDAALAQAAVSAVLKWKYTPAASRTIAEVSITFDPRREN